MTDCLNELIHFLDAEFQREKYQDSFEYTLLESSILKNGLVIKSSEIVKVVVGSVFAALNVLEKIINSKVSNILWITHHPFYACEKGYGMLNDREIQLMNENRISLYVLHMPLDLHDRFSNTVSLIEKLEISSFSEFGKYMDKNLGRIVELKSAQRLDEFVIGLKKKLEIPEECKIHVNGNNLVKRIGIIAGTVCQPNIVIESFRKKCDTIMVGTLKPDFTNRYFMEQYNIIQKLVATAELNTIEIGHGISEEYGMKKLISYLAKAKFEAVYLK